MSNNNKNIGIISENCVKDGMASNMSASTT